MSSLFVYIQRRGSKVLTNDVKTMLDTQNVDIDYMQGIDGPPLLEAANHRRWDICKLLFEEGARLDIVHPMQGALLNWLFVPNYEFDEFGDFDVTFVPGDRSFIEDCIRAGAQCQMYIKPDLHNEIKYVLQHLNAQYVAIKDLLYIHTKLGDSLTNMICQFLFARNLMKKAQLHE